MYSENDPGNLRNQTMELYKLTNCINLQICGNKVEKTQGDTVFPSYRGAGGVHLSAYMDITKNQVSIFPRSIKTH